MMSLPFLIAAALSAVWAAVHLFVGGPQVAVPLRTTRQISVTARETAYLCWHLVSVTLVLMAAFFLAAGLGVQGGLGLAMAGTALAAGFAGLGLVLPILIGSDYKQLPQGWLFLPVIALGIWGLMS